MPRQEQPDFPLAHPILKVERLDDERLLKFGEATDVAPRRRKGAKDGLQF
ncbi:MAG: hypothetical protein ABIW76_06240 [Fibrobacteria bacterium]